ncbi:MAG: chloride channel protein, partial [Acetobacteraceae bacterium]|nr:chloride channel protein [Acetobacteraceae bacterium]
MADLAGNRQIVRLRRVLRSRFISPRLWVRRCAFWTGALAIAVIAILFADAADLAAGWFTATVAARPWLAWGMIPAGFMAAVLLTIHVFPGAGGSGIPQAIAAIHIRDPAKVRAMLSLRIAFGKVALTLLGLACGASVGREGPTVQVGASIMHTLGLWLRLPRHDLQRGLILAGGAAGIAAAFNTPLAGIVFAIEELSHSFEARASGTVFTAVIIAGVTTLALVGNYSYFGHTTAELTLRTGWVAVLVCSAVGGVAGGLFAAVLIRAARGFPGLLGRAIRWQPMLFAGLCGLVVAGVGILSRGETYGTGYAQARSAVEGHADLVTAYPLLKLVANIASYLSGIPGGIFAPSLAVGATLGHVLSHSLAAP